jgi:SanA protein
MMRNFIKILSRKMFFAITKIVLIAILVCVVITVAISVYIGEFSEPYIYSDLEHLPSNRVGLIPGTAKYLMEGRLNRFYLYRVEAAVYLFKNNKIQYILVSGDNSTKYYNEPAGIKKDLIDQGIPEKHIFLDYAGFRTLDTVIRARDVFNLNEFTFISQPFQNERAIFIAKNHGINIIGFNARDVDVWDGFKTAFREYFARVMAFLDVFILNTSPKFGGKKIIIE